jgi:hypothetical protein
MTIETKKYSVKTYRKKVRKTFQKRQNYLSLFIKKIARQRYEFSEKYPTQKCSN